MRVRNVVVGSVTLLEAQLVEDLNSAISVDGANVGIGTDSPVRTCHIVKDPASRSAGGLLYALNQPLIIEDDNRPGIQLIGSENNIGIIEFADDAHANAGSINFDHSTDRLRFGFGDDAEKVYIDSSGNMVISGDLTVNGTTATVSTTNTVIEDKLLELGNGITGTPSGDAGIIIERGSSANAALIWDESRDEFVFGTTSATGASTGDLTVTPGNISVERIGAGTEQAEAEVHAKRDTASGVQYSTTASVIAEDDTRPSIQLAGGANNIGLIQFGDNAAEASGQIYYDHSTDKLRLDCGGNADRLTVDSNGNMVVAGNIEVGSTGEGISFTCTGEVTFDYSQQFLIKGLSGAPATIEIQADDGEDNADKCQIAVADGGVFSINNYGEGNWGAGLTLDFANNTVKAGHGGDTAYLASNGNYDVVLKTGNSTTGSITITDGANGDITLAPNGSGNVAVGSGSAAGVLMSNGTEDLQLVTSGTGPTLTLTDGTNGGITLEAHGTGDITVNADTLKIGDNNANATLTTQGTGDLILSTNSGTNSGTITIADGADGDITLQTNGDGKVAFGPGDAAAYIMSHGTQNLVLVTSGSGPTFTLTDGAHGGITLEPSGDGVAAVTGKLQVNSATATAAGAGFGDAASQNMYVSNINGEIVTTILVDIDGLQNGGALNDIIGDEGEANAYLTRLTPALNGYPYRVEMNCVEPPSVTGDASGGNKYSLAFNTAALAEDAAYTGGSNAVLVIDGTSNAWSDGMSQNNAGDVDLGMGGNYDSGGGAYVYIVAGSNVTGGNLEVTSGKFVIKVYAANF